MIYDISYGNVSYGPYDMDHKVWIIWCGPFHMVTRHMEHVTCSTDESHVISFFHIIWFHSYDTTMLYGPISYGLTSYGSIWHGSISYGPIWHGPTDHLVQAVLYNSISDECSLRTFYLDIDKTRYIKTETKRFFEVELTPKQIFDDGKASQLIKENSIIFEETLR